MTTMITKMKSIASTTILFTAAVIMTGLSFAFVGALAVFALMAVGVAMIAAPFVATVQPTSSDADITV